MRVRQMVNGDMTFGRSGGNFLANSPAAVAQVIGTRLGLWQGEWFLDTTEGTPWLQQVIGLNTAPLYDGAIRDRILSTPGVIGIAAYSSTFTAATRSLAVTAEISTAYGPNVTIQNPVSTSGVFTIGQSQIGGPDPIG